MYMPSPYRMLVQKFVDQLAQAGPTKESARECIWNDAVAHVPGSGKLAGDYRGPSGVVELFARARSVATGDYDLQVQSFHVAHALGAAVLHIGAQRDGAAYSDNVRLVMRLEGGKIKELWLDPVDGAAFDAFFSRS